MNTEAIFFLAVITILFLLLNLHPYFILAKEKLKKEIVLQEIKSVILNKIEKTINKIEFSKDYKSCILLSEEFLFIKVQCEKNEFNDLIKTIDTYYDLVIQKSKIYNQ